MNKRKGYEFSNGVRGKALDKEGLENGSVHHIIPVSVCRELGIPGWLCSSQANAKAYPDYETHMREAEHELSLNEYKTIAQGLLGWIDKLF